MILGYIFEVSTILMKRILECVFRQKYFFRFFTGFMKNQKNQIIAIYKTEKKKIMPYTVFATIRKTSYCTSKSIQYEDPGPL